MASSFEESPQNRLLKATQKVATRCFHRRLSEFYGNKIISASLFEKRVRQLAEEREMYKSAHSELNERECISREDKLEWEKRGNKVIPVCALFLGRISPTESGERKREHASADHCHKENARRHFYYSKESERERELRESPAGVMPHGGIHLQNRNMSIFQSFCHVLC
jgi:hypothetical protein